MPEKEVLVASGRRTRVQVIEGGKISIIITPEFQSEVARTHFDPLTDGSQPPDFAGLKCNVIIDGEKVDFEWEQKAEEVKLTFAIPPGEHDVIIFHVISDDGQEIPVVDFAQRLKIEPPK